MRRFTFRNNGSIEWPDDAHLEKVGGDDDLTVTLGRPKIDAQGRVQPGEAYTFEVICMAPKRVGKAAAVLTMSHSSGHFGEKISFTVTFEDNKLDDSQLLAGLNDSELMAKDKSFEEEVKMVSQDPIEPAGNNPFADKIPKAQPEIVNPKQVYSSRVDSTQISPKMREGLFQLYELGYTEFDINMALLKRYDMDVNAAAEHLIVHGTDGILPQ